MPGSKWKSLAQADPDREYLVLVSHLPLKRFSTTLRFSRLVRSVRRQLAEARGLVGYSLFAKPFSKQYWTLSVWENEAALQAFVRESPHQEVMSALAADMGKTQFARWQMQGSEGQPSWEHALRRLGPDGAP